MTATTTKTKKAKPFTTAPLGSVQMVAAPNIEIPRDPNDPHYRSLAERIARHRLYKKNEFIPFLKSLFPHKPDCWHVSRYFPYAEGGPLYVDEWEYPYEKPFCEAKQKALKARNLRCVVLGPKSTFEDAMQALLNEAGATQ